MDTTNPDTNIDATVDNAENVENVETNNAAEHEEIDYKAKYEETLAHSRKHEERAKANFEAANKWREWELSQKPEAERMAEELAQYRQEAALLKVETIKKDIALNKNIPAKLLQFLTGTTQEELESQADELLSVIAESAKPKTQPNPEQGKPSGDTKGDTLTSWIEQNLLNK